MATAASCASTLLPQHPLPRLPLSNAEAQASSCTARTSQTCGRQWPVMKISFPALSAGVQSSRPWRRVEVESQRGESHICRAQGPDEGKSCCGGSGEGHNGNGRCSSHGASEHLVDTSGIGKEFEALVSKKTMEEFEALYESGQMEGNISRSVMADVAGIELQEKGTSRDEKFLNVEDLLADVIPFSTSNGGLVFDSDFEDMLV